MEYMGNKNYWDEKFSNRSDKLLNPEKSLVQSIKHFKKGTVLDIACGDGRNTIFLIENGFRVTGIDFSSKALNRLERFAKRKNYLVNTKQIDLSIDGSLDHIGIFDNIVINHYRLNKKQLKNLKNHLTDNGILFICGFGDNNKVDSKFRKEDLIKLTDFEDINKSFQLINYIEDQDERGIVLTYIFRKIKA